MTTRGDDNVIGTGRSEADVTLEQDQSGALQ
jgi:hypothetical protein